MKKHIDNEEILDSMVFDIGDNAVSHFETTGLIPALAENDYEIDSYKEIMEYSQRPISEKEPAHNRESQE